MDILSGVFPVILVGDVAQLQPVSNKTLYKSVPVDAVGMMGHFTFDITVKLLQQVNELKVINLIMMKLPLMIFLNDWRMEDLRSQIGSSVVLEIYIIS